MRAAVFLLLAIASVMSEPACADESLPLLFTRANVTVVRKSMPPLPWSPAEPAANPEMVFDTEIRDGTTLYNQSGWINLSSPGASQSILFAFSAPVIAPIIPSQNYAALDFLLIDRQGTIIQILPKLRLSTLQEEIQPSKPISAFMLLRGGTCEAYSINPGDYVLHGLFKRPPKVIAAPPS